MTVRGSAAGLASARVNPRAAARRSAGRVRLWAASGSSAHSRGRVRAYSSFSDMGGGGCADPSFYLLVEQAPSTIDARLQRPEVDLVRHLRALLDPVAEIHVRQPQFVGLGDLPQHVVGA